MSSRECGNKMRKIAVYLGLFVMAVLAPYVLASPAYDVSVEVGPPKTAKPGDLVTLVFVIENTGTVADQYDLKLTLPAGWTALPIPDQVSLAVGETIRVFLTVIVPAVTAAGAYGAVLRAVSAADPSVWAEAEGVIELIPTAGLQLETFQISRAPPGAEARYVFRIRNTGNVVDTYRIKVRIDKDWTLRVSPAEIQVLPGSQGEFIVTVLVPRTVAPGTRYYLWIEATSTVDSTITQTLAVTATVAPPQPEEVRVELYPELPLTIQFQITEAGDPTFRLSLVGELPGIGRLRAARSLGLLGLLDQDAGFYTSEWGVDWGSVSVSGAFAGLSGEGLRFLANGIRVGATELLLTDAGKGFAGSLEWETGTLRLVSVSVETAPGYGVNEIQFTGRLSESFSLAAILATATTQTGAASAFQIKPSIHSDGVSGHLALAEVSPGFPEQPESNTFGWGLSFGGMASPLRGGFSTGRTVTLTDPGPPQVFTTTQSLQATGSFSPNRGTSLGLKLSWEEKESDDTPKTVEEGSSALNLTFAQTMDRTSWSLGTSFKQAWDDVAGTEFLTQGLTISAEMPLGQITLSCTLSLEKIRDLVTDTVSETSSSFSLSCAFPQSPLAPTIKLAVSNGEASLSTELAWADVVAGWELAASLSIPLIAEGGFSSTLEFTFPVSFPFFGPTYGILKGRAFIDENKNGRFEPGEKGVPELLLSANGQQAVTGNDGRFVFWPLLPGRYQVTVAEMPFGLSPLRRLPVEVILERGQEVELSIPLESKSRIGGFVFHDRNQNRARDAGEEGVAGVEILIAGATVRKRASTDEVGRFSVAVPPGTYTVELVVASLPVRFEPTTPTKVQVLVKERAFVRVQFGVYQHPRPVIFAPQAPIARFDHTPKIPSVGEKVSFDASASQAFDAEIVSYEWEFRKGAKVSQTSGRRVTVIFDEAGSWLVTLKVTDSNGRTGQSQKVVTVR